MDQALFELEKKQYLATDFIKSECNQLAYNMVKNWPDQNWGVEPYPKALLINAPKSSGKSFLAHIWSENSGAIFIDVTQDLQQDMIDSHNGFTIDDISLINDELKFFHYFNAIAEARKYLLMTTSKIPDFKLPDLDSRIKSVNIVNIDQPDDELMKMLIFKFFSDRFAQISIEAVNYLLNHLPRNFNEFQGCLYEINQLSLKNQHKVTIPFIKKFLSQEL